ncbi:putative rhamnosyl transferase [uncultured Pelagimonas sp.]|uniref:putative rhamnosyl transferase n=1 Tax=uncultured Pelagimonas sp. TaxID=1618102 RepID=UPI002608DEFD|nr:putative rhamnosyl transferase [uncultured Pelagimonas sp.]
MQGIGQVIGFCRFSYPAEGGFQVEHETLQDRIDYLYQPDRIEERFRHFETICLPGLKAQTDPDFIFAILVGDAMPVNYLERLMILVEDFPQAVVIPRAPGPHRKVCQEVINSLRVMDEPCLQFRHDDDDAVSIHFVERLKKAATDCAPLLDQHRLVGFDWNRGFVARPDANGVCGEPIVHPYWGLAQAVAVKPGVRQTVMNFGHQKINQFMPTVTFTDEVMYVRGHNDHNDSRQKKHVKPVVLPPLETEDEALFKSLFGIDTTHVKTVFGG